MALPSQMPRSGESVPRLNSGMSSGRSRSSRVRIIGLVVVILVVGAAWWLWPKGPKPAEAASLDGVFEPAGATAAPQKVATRDPEPPVQTMGVPNRADTSAPVTDSSAIHATMEPDAVTDTATPTTTAAIEIPVEPIPEPPPVRVSAAVTAIRDAGQLMDRSDPVRARDVLNRALYDASTSDAEKAELRKRMGEIAEMVTFSARVFPGDPMADTYTIVSGDRLSKIPAREGFRIDYRMLQRLNGIKDPNTIRVGQKLKALYGPFHAVVDKSEFRMDIYADQKDTAGNRLYVTSLRVGLGEMGSTPIGTWKVRSNSKLINPKWVNPRTGEVFAPNDPAKPASEWKNPIGCRWIGLIGTDDQTKLLDGYGIHGTIDPTSIGRNMSMGCVRLNNEDVDLVFDLLVEDQSTVRIEP